MGSASLRRAHGRRRWRTDPFSAFPARDSSRSDSSMEQITDISRAESAAVLELLLAQATRPEYTVRFRWEPGSVAFW
ncbi:TauD/TfdA family dioxygenase, partial [Streptomyces sp. W16]|uniref:TauD/TfdA family dioxygenase n=1 Tax=Streptomyces sp. W16 TaxID=3076631 RepID=UPI00295A8012